MSVRLQLASSLEKIRVFAAPTLGFYPLTVLQGDQISFQVAFYPEKDSFSRRVSYTIAVESPLADWIQVRQVEQVPVLLPAFDASDGGYIDTAPGLYPDLLRTLYEENHAFGIRGQWSSLWVEVSPDASVPAGTYPCTITDT